MVQGTLQWEVSNVPDGGVVVYLHWLGRRCCLPPRGSQSPGQSFRFFRARGRARGRVLRRRWARAISHHPPCRSRHPTFHPTNSCYGVPRADLPHRRACMEAAGDVFGRQRDSYHDGTSIDIYVMVTTPPRSINHSPLAKARNCPLIDVGQQCARFLTASDSRRQCYQSIGQPTRC